MPAPVAAAWKPASSRSSVAMGVPSTPGALASSTNHVPVSSLSATGTDDSTCAVCAEDIMVAARRPATMLTRIRRMGGLLWGTARTRMLTSADCMYLFARILSSRDLGRRLRRQTLGPFQVASQRPRADVAGQARSDALA